MRKKIHIKLILYFLFIMLVLFTSTQVSAINATGSQYTLSKISLTAGGGVGNGTNYSGQSTSVDDSSTNNAQGLQYGAVLGISGTATLTPNKIPIINSYSVTPIAVNKTLPVRLFISAVYTNKTSIDITRPNGVIDNIDTLSQSVFYYPYTDLVGKYVVKFNAQGNGIVTAETYFDVVEPVVASSTVPVSESGGRGVGGSSYVINDDVSNDMYLSVSIYCFDIANVVVKVTNQTDSPLSGVLLVLNSSSISMNSSTDKKGTATFDVKSGNYTIAAYYSGYATVIHDYEVYCVDKKMGEDITGEIISNDSAPITSDMRTNDLNAIVTTSLEESNKSLSLSITSLIIAVSTAILSTIMLFAVLMMLLYNAVLRRNQEGFGIYNLNGQSRPSLVVSPSKIAPTVHVLTPVERAMIEADEEAWRIQTKDLDKPIHEIKHENVQQINEKVSVEKTMLKEEESPKEKSQILFKKIETKKICGLVNQSTQKIIDVPQGSEFVVYSGERVYNVPDLLLELRYMPDEIFNYHVTAYKNDFATWIYHVVGDKELAGELGPIKSKNKMIELIHHRLMRSGLK